VQGGRGLEGDDVGTLVCTGGGVRCLFGAADICFAGICAANSRARGGGTLALWLRMRLMLLLTCWGSWAVRVVWQRGRGVLVL